MQNNPNGKKNTIQTIVISIIALAIAVGTITGGVIYLKNNKDKYEWDLITFPWEKKGFMWPWEQGNYTTEEAIQKEIEEESVVIQGLRRPDFDEPQTYETTYGTVVVDSIKLDKKGFEIDITYASGEYAFKGPLSLEINKIIVDDLDFQLEPFVLDVDSNEIVKISRTNFELYNKNGFQKITLYYKENSSRGESNYNTLEISVPNRVPPTTKIGKKISIDKKETVNGNINIYYWKRITDSNNTYLYFYVENGPGTKTLSIKKLLLNGKLYEYPNLMEEFYPSSKRGFALKIPKSDIKKVKNMEVTFFIKTESTDNYGEGIYLTNEYSATIKD